VFALREILALGGEDREAPAEHLAGVGGVDHVIDKPAFGCDVGVRVSLGVVLDQLGPPCERRLNTLLCLHLRPINVVV
jgi:hypothetical protein